MFALKENKFTDCKNSCMVHFFLSPGGKTQNPPGNTCESAVGRPHAFCGFGMVGWQGDGWLKWWVGAVDRIHGGDYSVIDVATRLLWANATRTALALVALVALAGCSKGPPASLSGEIRYLDMPIESGGIRLFPIPDTPGVGAAAVVTDGRYEFPIEKGLFAGRYRVQLFASRKTGRKIEIPPGEADEGTLTDEYESFLPDIYGTTSILTVELAAGSNTYDFHLTKTGETKP